MAFGLLCNQNDQTSFNQSVFRVKKYYLTFLEISCCSTLVKFEADKEKRQKMVVGFDGVVE